MSREKILITTSWISTIGNAILSVSKIITIEITTSVAESIPSPTTAKLPANKPIMILDMRKRKGSQQRFYHS